MAFLLSKRKSVLLSYYREEETALFAQVGPNELYRSYLSRDESERRGGAVNVGFHHPIADRRTYKVIEAVAAAPKEVSLLFAFGDRACREETLRAHMEAVDETLRLIEVELTYATTTRGGEVRREAGVVEPLSFTHILTRAGDPHLHSHILIPNSVKLGGRAYALSFDVLSYGAKYADIVYLTSLKSRLSRPEVAKSLEKAAMLAIAPNLSEQFSKRSREVDLFDAFKTHKSRVVAQRLSRLNKGDMSDLSQVFEGWEEVQYSVFPKVSKGTIDEYLDNAIMNVFRSIEERALINGVDHLFLRARERVRQTLENANLSENPIVAKLSVDTSQSLSSDPISRVVVKNEATLASKFDDIAARGWRVKKVLASRSEELVMLDEHLRRSSDRGIEVISTYEDRIPSIGEAINSTTTDFDQLRSIDLNERKVVLVASATSLPVLLDVVPLDRASDVEIIVVDSGRYSEDRAIGRGAAIRSQILSGLVGVDNFHEVGYSPALTINFDEGTQDRFDRSPQSTKQDIVFHSSANSIVAGVVDLQAKNLEGGGLIYPDQQRRSRVVVRDDALRTLISGGISHRLRSRDNLTLDAQAAQFRSTTSRRMKEKYLSFCEVHPLRKEMTIKNCNEPVAFNAFGIMSQSEFDRTVDLHAVRGNHELAAPSEICRVVEGDSESRLRLEPIPLPKRVLRRATFGERAVALLAIDARADPMGDSKNVSIEQIEEDRASVDMVEHLAESTSKTRNSAQGSIDRRIARILDVDSLVVQVDATDHGRIVANVRALSHLVTERRRVLGLPLGISSEKISRIVEVGLSYFEKEELRDLNRGSTIRQGVPRELLKERELGISL